MKRWFVLLLIACGCASNDAPPVATDREPVDFQRADGVRYRKLTRSDFKAPTPPNNGLDAPIHAAAALVATVQADPTWDWVVAPLKMSDTTMVEATVGDLRFHAAINPEASWLSAELDSAAAAYVLEHEQIHFAIFELEARSLNARIGDIAQRVRSIASDSEGARRIANARLEQEIRASDQRIAERQSDFDRDTANGKLRHRQQEWWSRIQLELANTAWSR